MSVTVTNITCLKARIKGLFYSNSVTFRYHHRPETTPDDRGSELRFILIFFLSPHLFAFLLLDNLHQPWLFFCISSSSINIPDGADWAYSGQRRNGCAPPDDALPTATACILLPGFFSRLFHAKLLRPCLWQPGSCLLDVGSLHWILFPLP